MSLKILAPEFLDHVQITCRSRACLLGVFSDVETPTLPLILTTILSRRRRSIRWNIARMRPGQKTVTKIQSKSSELMKNVPQTSPIPQAQSNEFRKHESATKKSYSMWSSLVNMIESDPVSLRLHFG
jgi:hypothetical protein